MPQMDDLVEIFKQQGLFNQIEITYFDDGSGLKIETGAFDPAQHILAEKFIKGVQELMGGNVKISRKMANRTRTQQHVKQGQGGGHSH